jgi:hypothetical protein
VAVLQLFRTIKEDGYTGSLTLIHRYLTPGRADAETEPTDHTVPPRPANRPGNPPVTE